MSVVMYGVSISAPLTPRSPKVLPEDPLYPVLDSASLDTVRVTALEARVGMLADLVKSMKDSLKSMESKLSLLQSARAKKDNKRKR